MLLERVGITDRADERVETYSRGMKQRLHLARGLIGDAKVLFLDEPTTGMDPLAAREFRALIGELRGEGRTILLATHDMAEAEALCDRVTLIDRGAILATESPRTLGRVISRFQRIDVEGAADDVVAQIAALAGVASVVTGRHRHPHRGRRGGRDGGRAEAPRRLGRDVGANEHAEPRRGVRPADRRPRAAGLMRAFLAGVRLEAAAHSREPGRADPVLHRAALHDHLPLDRPQRRPPRPPAGRVRWRPC